MARRNGWRRMHGGRRMPGGAAGLRGCGAVGLRRVCGVAGGVAGMAVALVQSGIAGHGSEGPMPYAVVMSIAANCLAGHNGGRRMYACRYGRATEAAMAGREAGRRVHVRMAM